MPDETLFMGFQMHTEVADFRDVVIVHRLLVFFYLAEEKKIVTLFKTADIKVCFILKINYLIDITHDKLQFKRTASRWHPYYAIRSTKV